MVVDNVLGARLATEHLIDAGAQRIACVTGPSRVSTARERLTGYQQALRARGRPTPGDLVRRADFKEDGGYAAARALLAGRPRPDALFVANNLMTLGALRAITEAGLRVPDDILTRRLRRCSRGPPSCPPRSPWWPSPPTRSAARPPSSSARPARISPPATWCSHRRSRCGHRPFAARRLLDGDAGHQVRLLLLEVLEADLLVLEEAVEILHPLEEVTGGDLLARLGGSERLEDLFLVRWSCRSASRAWRPAWPSWRGRAGASRSSFAVQPWVLPFLLTPDLSPGMTEPPAPECRRLQPNGCGTR